MMDVHPVGSCEWCGCTFRSTRDAMNHRCAAMQEAAENVRAERTPYVGEGADGARRSAQIDREEIATLPADHPRVAALEESAAQWDRQAERDHERERERLRHAYLARVAGERNEADKKAVPALDKATAVWR